MNGNILKGLIVLAALAFVVDPILAVAGEVKKIGILMFSEEDRYIEAKRGFVDQLKQDGFAGSTVKYSIELADGSKAKAVELVQKFAAAKPDLIFTLGTQATLTVGREIKDVPIVFAVVYDPIEAGIAMDWKSSGNNTTGASSRIPMLKVVNIL